MGWYFRQNSIAARHLNKNSFHLHLYTCVYDIISYIYCTNIHLPTYVYIFSFFRQKTCFFLKFSTAPWFKPFPPISSNQTTAVQPWMSVRKISRRKVQRNSTSSIPQLQNDLGSISALWGAEGRGGFSQPRPRWREWFFCEGIQEQL